MNPDVKKLWVDALKSGDYHQTYGVLRHPDGQGKFEHCCLGVLCELYAKAGRVEWDGVSRISRSSTLPLAVQSWAGLDLCDPIVDNTGHKGRLVYKNDMYKLTFPEIAELIDKAL